MAVSNIDIAWMAGLLEGEATFYVRPPRKNSIHKTPVIQIVMTDKEPIEKIAKLLGYKVGTPPMHKGGTKSLYRVNIYGERAFGLTQTIYGLMSPRRQSQIRLMWAAWQMNPRWRKGASV